MTASSPRNSALDLLARRDHGRAELGRKLEARGFERDAIESALDGLAADNLLSDARFAESFVSARAARGDGPLKIGHQLRERGVAEGTVSEALSVAGIDWDERARQVRIKRFGEPVPADYAGRARQGRFLAQRGFSTEQARNAVSR